MSKKVARWIGNKLKEEFVETLSQESSGMPGDWITPASQIGLEAGRAIGALAGKAKAWSTTKKCIVCRSKPTCGDCKKCQSHCKCTLPEVPTEDQATKTEWMCTHCGTPQPKNNRKCDSCGAARPFTY